LGRGRVKAAIKREKVTPATVIDELCQADNRVLRITGSGVKQLKVPLWSDQAYQRLSRYKSQYTAIKAGRNQKLVRKDINSPVLRSCPHLGLQNSLIPNLMNQETVYKGCSIVLNKKIFWPNFAPNGMRTL